MTKHRTCPTCGKGTLSSRTVERTYHVKGIPVRVSGVLVWACDTCAEEVLSQAERRKALARAEVKAQTKIAA